MILHTIIGEEDIFFSQAEYTKETVQMDGMHIECCVSNGERRVDRIISTNPADYINAAYMPGKII